MNRFVQPLLVRLRALAAQESGATSIEYGLLASLLAVSLITVMDNLGATLNESYNNISTELSQATGGADESPGVAPAESAPGG